MSFSVGLIHSDVRSLISEEASEGCVVVPVFAEQGHSWYKTQLQGPESRSVFPHAILDRDEMQAPSFDNSTQYHNPKSRYQSEIIISSFRRALTSQHHL